MNSHKRECMSYAMHVAEGALLPRHGWPTSFEVEEFAVELLTTGEVACICSELPS